MGVMYDYFTAPSDAEAAAVIDVLGGPIVADPPIRTVETKFLDPVVAMGQLEEVLTGRAYAEIVEDPRSGKDLVYLDDGEVAVLTVTDGLRDGLVGVKEPRLSEVAAAWAKVANGGDYYDPADLRERISELVGLAEEAVMLDQRLYCWMCV